MYKITIEMLHDDYLDRPTNDKKTIQNMVSDEMIQNTRLSSKEILTMVFHKMLKELEEFNNK